MKTYRCISIVLKSPFTDGIISWKALWKFFKIGGSLFIIILGKTLVYLTTKAIAKECKKYKLILGLLKPKWPFDCFFYKQIHV